MSRSKISREEEDHSASSSSSSSSPGWGEHGRATRRDSRRGSVRRGRVTSSFRGTSSDEGDKRADKMERSEVSSTVFLLVVNPTEGYFSSRELRLPFGEAGVPVDAEFVAEGGGVHGALGEVAVEDDVAGLDFFLVVLGGADEEEDLGLGVVLVEVGAELLAEGDAGARDRGAVGALEEEVVVEEEDDAARGLLDELACAVHEGVGDVGDVAEDVRGRGAEVVREARQQAPLRGRVVQGHQRRVGRQREGLLRLHVPALRARRHAPRREQHHRNDRGAPFFAGGLRRDRHQRTQTTPRRGPSYRLRRRRRQRVLLAQEVVVVRDSPASRPRPMPRRNGLPGLTCGRRRRRHRSRGRRLRELFLNDDVGSVWGGVRGCDSEW
mmetsp:Transcript_4549/g.14241  ORF Transcript_4549/g.14241 Transcript_4549/m.14241 type:complete len:381 (+) Transcript_4549:906-2048(+)